MHPFRKAVEDRDEAAIQALLADDVVFTSPVAFKPYVGKPITAAILCGVLRVFEDFRYVREIHDSHGGHHALEFETGIAGAAGVTVNVPVPFPLSVKVAKGGRLPALKVNAPEFTDVAVTLNTVVVP